LPYAPKPPSIITVPFYQHDIHFTLDEARDLLPWLREKLARICDIFSDLTNRGFDVLQGKWTPRGNGHSSGPPPEGYDEFIELVGELDRRGVLIKEFSKGVVDFPHIHSNGEEVYLCWALDEPTVAYWHRIPEGFIGRMPAEEPPPDEKPS
jgi:hypothetical protein